MALSIFQKVKMTEKVLKSDYSANESLLILCLCLIQNMGEWGVSFCEHCLQYF